MTATQPARRRMPLWQKLPIIQQLRQSLGLQRGMLVAGLVLTGFFLLVALLAPVLAPYGYSELRNADGLFGAQQPPSAAHQAPTRSSRASLATVRSLFQPFQICRVTS